MTRSSIVSFKRPLWKKLLILLSLNEAVVSSTSGRERTTTHPADGARGGRRLAAFLSVRGTSLDDDSLLWQEIEDPSSMNHPLFDNDDETEAYPPRKTIWWGRFDEEFTWKMKDDDKVSAKAASSSSKVVHPLRTGQYHLTIKWKKTKDHVFLQNGNENGTDDWYLEFDVPTGLCRATTTTTREDASNNSVPHVVGHGEWQNYPWGIHCRLRLNDQSELILIAGVNLNPFGSHAKFVEGNILWQSSSGVIFDPIQDEPMLTAPRPWFRPVIGTFSGVSLGESQNLGVYPNRGVGLSN